MPLSYSLKKRSQAVSLRKQGKSFRNVARHLNVSLSTAHLWTKDIVLSEEMKQKMIVEHAQKLILGREKFIAERKDKKIERESQIFIAAKNEVEKRKSDPFFIMGLALYWAEGFKRDHSLGFVNSDPIMIRFFLKWLKTYGGCSPANIRMRVQIHEIYEPYIMSVQSYWSVLLQIPISQFQAPFYQVSKSKPDLIDNEYKGLLRVRVIGARGLFVRILGWLDGLREVDY